MCSFIELEKENYEKEYVIYMYSAMLIFEYK